MDEEIDGLRELRSRWIGGQVDLPTFAAMFEAALWQSGAPGREYEAAARSLTNAVELIRFTRLDENQKDAVTAVVDEAVRLVRESYAQS